LTLSATILATRRMFSPVATEVPPNFITIFFTLFHTPSVT
jgi:hypothetical protein